MGLGTEEISSTSLLVFSFVFCEELLNPSPYHFLLEVAGVKRMTFVAYFNLYLGKLR